MAIGRDVRKAAIKAIAITKVTLGAILSRIRDTCEDVRIAVYDRLTGPVKVRHLTAAQRQQVLQGVTDRCVLGVDSPGYFPKMWRVAQINKGGSSLHQVAMYMAYSREWGCITPSQPARCRGKRETLHLSIERAIFFRP